MRQATNAKAAKPASSPPNHANPYGLNNKWTGSAKNSAGASSRWYNLAPTNPARHGKEIRASASPEFLAAIPRRARSARSTKYALSMAQATIRPKVGIVQGQNGMRRKGIIGNSITSMCNGGGRSRGGRFVK